MGFVDCLINGTIIGALVLYKDDGTVSIGWRGQWTKASWNADFKMWSIQF